MADDRSSKNQNFRTGSTPAIAAGPRPYAPRWLWALLGGLWRAWHSCLYTIIAKPIRGRGMAALARLICNPYRRVFRSNFLLIKKSPSTYTYASSGCGWRTAFPVSWRRILRDAGGVPGVSAGILNFPHKQWIARPVRIIYLASVPVPGLAP